MKKEGIILIKNGTIVRFNESLKADILIEAGKIAKIQTQIDDFEAFKVIDASGKYVFAGGIDPHVHLDLPTPAGNSSDNFESGSKAAVFGGTTTVIDFVTPFRNQNLIEALNLRKADAKNCYTDFSFHVSPIGWNEDTENQIIKCIKEEGISSFKVYMAYDIGLDDYELVKVMNAVGKQNGLVTVHAENGKVIEFLRQKSVLEGNTSPKYHALTRPVALEEEAINRAIEIAKLTDCKLYVVHISSAKGMLRIEKAQREELPIYAETCPHYLLLDESLYNQEFKKSAKYVLSPPLRTLSDQEKLWASLSIHTIQSIGTDHCPFNLKGQKDAGIHDFTKIPNGAGGIEYRLSLLYTYGVLTGKITMNQFVGLVSTLPARIFGLGRQKGDLKIGLDADVVIWNPDAEKIISLESQHQNCDSNIYEGLKIKGVAETVLLRGELIIENEQLVSQPCGIFLKRGLGN